MAEIKEETPAPKAESIKEDTKPESPEQPKKQAAPKKTTVPKKEAKGTVLITGATSGIGKATAELFAQNGYRLILTGRRKERLEELKAHFESEYGNDNMILSFDVRNQKAVDKALSKLPKEFSEVDILINNAGLAKGLDPIHKGSLEHWETMIDTNVKGLLYVTRCISPGMVERKSGHIINLGSSAGKEAYPNGNVYCATKFAVDALTKAIRMDLHSYNIRVSQVSPGHVEETEFAINRFDGDKKRAKIYEDFQPLKSSDVADVIYFMATRPAHVNIQDVQMFGTQQASSMIIDRSGRKS
ncbi:MAG: SDR family oxidoreductase [Lewinellaceae bacterium]|nr:SDR family oxidoreductase [Lewinellaceae bacterium]